MRRRGLRRQRFTGRRCGRFDYHHQNVAPAYSFAGDVSDRFLLLGVFGGGGARLPGGARLLGGVFGGGRLPGGARLLGGLFGSARLPGGDLHFGQNLSEFDVNLAKKQSKAIAFDAAAHSLGNFLAKLRKRHKLGV